MTERSRHDAGRRIDVHAHYIPPFYRQTLVDVGAERPDGIVGLPEWTPALACETMDTLRIDTAFLSISSPGVYFGDRAQTCALTRAVNDYGAALMHDHPDRFGLFATLPLPDVEASLAEISHAMDTLGADGIALKTNHHGTYLGDAAFDRVFDALDERGAVVFIHPTSPSCACCTTTLSMGYPRPMIEFFFETTRAVTNLILSGTTQRCPNIRFIVPHAGATLPVVAERIAQLAPLLGLDERITPDAVYAGLRGFYYDLAGFPIPRQLDTLLSIADVDRLFYGSDWPFTPVKIADEAGSRLDTTPLFDDVARAAVYHGNALRLFPHRLSGIAR